MKVALFNFFLAAIMGALMRYAFVEELLWMDYRNMMHGHSHVALLGWIYMALYTLLLYFFLPVEKRENDFYKRLFWFTQTTVVGMAVAFPLQGYAGYSIVFSSLHIIASYLFMWHFLKDARVHNAGKYSFRFVQLALWFMVLSTLAIWAMPALMAVGMRGSALYYATVQFYLHFQFNGWVIFAILGLFFKLCEFHQLYIPVRKAGLFIFLLTVSSLLTYVLAVTWSTPLPVLFWINSAGVALQLAALIYFVSIFSGLGSFLDGHFAGWARDLLLLAFVCFLLKIVVQTAVILPQIGVVAYTIRNFVLGFLHLLLLGMATCFLLGFALHKNLLSLSSKLAKTGLVFLMSGIVGSELLLFGQGVLLWSSFGFVPGYYEVIFWVSAGMAMGVGMLGTGQCRGPENVCHPEKNG